MENAIGAINEMLNRFNNGESVPGWHVVTLLTELEEEIVYLQNECDDVRRRLAVSKRLLEVMAQ